MQFSNVKESTVKNLENNLHEKIDLYLNTVTVEGFSIDTLLTKKKKVDCLKP